MGRNDLLEHSRPKPVGLKLKAKYSNIGYTVYHTCNAFPAIPLHLRLNEFYLDGSLLKRHFTHETGEAPQMHCWTQFFFVSAKLVIYFALQRRISIRRYEASLPRSTISAYSLCSSAVRNSGRHTFDSRVWNSSLARPKRAHRNILMEKVKLHQRDTERERVARQDVHFCNVSFNASYRPFSSFFAQFLGISMFRAFLQWIYMKTFLPHSSIGTQTIKLHKITSNHMHFFGAFQLYQKQSHKLLCTDRHMIETKTLAQW